MKDFAFSFCRLSETSSLKKVVVVVMVVVVLLVLHLGSLVSVSSSVSLASDI